MNKNMQKHVLKNGLTVLLSPINHVRSASIGVFAKTGSCNEASEESGISHFVEHMLFKGTKRRTSKEIVSAIEGKGGELNAFTDKELTCYTARVIDTEINTAIDVLADMYQNSVFSPEELEMEKGVVLEEISRSQDNPEGYVHHLFMENRWKGCVHGREILGKPETVSSLKSANLHKHVRTKYTGPNTVISVAGNFDPKQLLKEIEKQFAGLSDEQVLERPSVILPALGNTTLQRDTEQAYFCIGYDGVNSTDDSRFAVKVLNTAFGSEMYSRLFQEIREKRGLAYSVGSYALSYKPGGLFVAYGGINVKNWDEVQSIVSAEMEDVCLHGLKPEELEMAKDTLAGSVVLSQETPTAIMHKTAQSEIIFGRDQSIDEFIEKIKAVTNEDIIGFTRDNCRASQSSFALICPKSTKGRGILSRLTGK